MDKLVSIIITVTMVRNIYLNIYQVFLGKNILTEEEIFWDNQSTDK